MVRIKATDNEGRYLEPFISYLVMNPSDEYEMLEKKWGAVFVDGDFLTMPGTCAYLQFEDPKMATAFVLRWSGAAQVAIDQDEARE